MNTIKHEFTKYNDRVEFDPKLYKDNKKSSDSQNTYNVNTKQSFIIESDRVRLELNAILPQVANKFSLFVVDNSYLPENYD